MTTARKLLAGYKTSNLIEGIVLQRDNDGHKVSIYLQDCGVVHEDSQSITLNGVIAYQRDPEKFWGSHRQIFFEKSDSVKTKISTIKFEGSKKIPHGNIFIGELS